MKQLLPSCVGAAFDKVAALYYDKEREFNKTGSVVRIPCCATVQNAQVIKFSFLSDNDSALILFTQLSF